MVVSKLIHDDKRGSSNFVRGIVEAPCGENKNENNFDKKTVGMFLLHFDFIVTGVWCLGRALLSWVI